MTKVRKTNASEKHEKSSENLVGSSNNPNLTAKAHYKEFINREGVITFSFPDTKSNKLCKPPKRNGTVVTSQLTKRAKSKIKRTGRIFEHLAKKKRRKAMCSMITLSYPYFFPKDIDSKQHLDNFIKRMRRYLPDFMYVWVAEKQKRGAIHYHILTPDYIPKHVINKAWEEIVEKWYIKMGYDFKIVMPNVIGVKKAGSYITKYLEKGNQEIEGNRYSMSKNCRDLISPVVQHTFKCEPENLKNAVEDLIDHLGIEAFPITIEDLKTNEEYTIGFWLRNSDGFFKHLFEFFQGPEEDLN